MKKITLTPSAGGEIAMETITTLKMGDPLIMRTTTHHTTKVLKFSVATKNGEQGTVQCSGLEIVALAALLRVEAYKLSHKDEKTPF